MAAHPSNKPKARASCRARWEGGTGACEQPPAPIQTSSGTDQVGYISQAARASSGVRERSVMLAGSMKGYIVASAISDSSVEGMAEQLGMATPRSSTSRGALGTRQ